LTKNKKNNKLTLPEINTAYENRKLELIKNVDIASLKVGDILQDISNFTNQDSPVQVAKINKNSVILKYGNVTQEVTEDELVNNFVKPTNEPTMEEVVKPSQETVDASEQTKTDASENLSKKEFLDRSEKEADESSEDDLFKNLEDNSKTC
jgi:multidrug efflux pump subunit AcrB